MLRVSVNMKQGVYIISEDDGQKEIRVPMSGKYDKIERNRRIQALKNYPTFTPEEKSKMLDFGLYDALGEFDAQYGTSYAKRYFDTTTKQIPLTGVSEKQRAYEKRATDIKSKEFADAGISFQYNVSLFGGPKEMSFGERLRVIGQALTQRKNGVKVQLSDSKQPLLPPPSVQQEEIEDDIPPMPDEETLKKIREEIANEKTKSEERELQSKSNPVESIPQVQIPQERIDELLNPNQRNVDEMLQNIRVEEAQNSEVVINPAVAELQAALSGRRVASTSRDTQTPKKKISRSKAIQASKKAKRDAGKLKNRYEGMQQAVAERKARATDPEQLRLAAERRAAKEEQRRIAEEQRKAAEAEQKRAEAERKRAEQEQKRQEAEKNKPKNRILALMGRGPKVEEGSFKARFTRKLKDKKDSIRNKKFLPNLTHKQRKIAKAATIVGLTAALALTAGIGTYKLLNSHTVNVKGPTNRPATVETVKPDQNVDKDGIDYILGEHGTQTPTQTPSTQTPSKEEQVKPSNLGGEEVKPGAPVQEETNQGGSQEQDSKREYLSSIKVGAALNIDSGRYFETPEGQGNYGHFENFTNGVKRIQFIDVMTNDGCIIIKDDSVNLWELKQQYPDAKFSYHIVYENEDGTTRPLGWLTSESQELDQQRNIADVDMDM